MTNGEKLNQLFPDGICPFSKSWLDCEYKEPTTKNDLGVDCISRAEVLKLMKDNWHTHNGDWAMQESMDDIRALPSVTPQEPKWIHAKWKQLDNEPDTFFTTHQYECSNCGKIQLAKSKNIKKFRYCSKCGADMREVKE